jgi:hypothetical protein
MLPFHEAIPSLKSLLLCTLCGYGKLTFKDTDSEIRNLQKREAAGTVHLNPIVNHISGRDYAIQCMQPAQKDDEDDD